MKKFRVSHSCREYMEPLQEAFGIDVAKDNDEKNLYTLGELLILELSSQLL